ncbi:fatty acid-binding protein DegV [Candidatus Epulonipiscium fishelsonii]|uniref:Fatty acid-binding protein DegV n=1 Tax=Candidatus Epulonipiscium fishelsonii TaxID=77094 RepID=A0ACC8XB90_9FIRM|nr:fatty acid-binding protein DegV [Epulopiscium sp. SCG-B05WGA-EpuloA1]ONI39660.1 fatty acid-binding protein DegV [Epulopiscium sp. SCG-B11WGA-EpuloA1]ONI47513.1 fatty acid-binding protein DegV [Epulopiscium sp. SCG-C06WGA-EpuloA1]
MKKIAVVTDSACDLSSKTIEEYGIYQIPLKIIYKNAEYLDKVTISSKEMYARLNQEVPTTSLPDVEYAQGVIQSIIDEGYTDILVVCISTQLSGTLNSLKIICEEYTNVNFYFIDSKTLGYPEGVVAVEVAKYVKAGLSIEEILNKVPGIQKRLHGYINVDSLDHLIKGGRLSKTAGAVGTILNFKPIIGIDHEKGILYSESKPRGRKKAFSELIDILKNVLKRSKCEVWVLTGDADSEAKDFYNQIKDFEGITQISIEEIGAAMGIHTGPGVVGLVILEAEK